MSYVPSIMTFHQKLSAYTLSFLTDKDLTDIAMTGLEKLNEIINKTEFDWDDIGLMPCYADYISIWEEKTDGLDFHTADGLTKEGYIIKTEEKIRKYLEEWLITNGGI